LFSIGPLHALDGLLRAVAGFGSLRFVDVPHARLLVTAAPVSRGTLADSISARLMLEMIMPAANCEVIFRPNYLRAQSKTCLFEGFIRFPHTHGRVPHIGNVVGRMASATRPAAVQFHLLATQLSQLTFL
jgi:hypothetical protein